MLLTLMLHFCLFSSICSEYEGENDLITANHHRGTDTLLQFNQYSGYLHFFDPHEGHPNLRNISMFYWLVESESGSDDPLVIWLNGGPGASSLFGLFTENGPFYVNPLPKKRLIRNQWSWNKVSGQFVPRQLALKNLYPKLYSIRFDHHPLVVFFVVQWENGVFGLSQMHHVGDEVVAVDSERLKPKYPAKGYEFTIVNILKNGKVSVFCSQTAHQNLLALKTFYKKFPKYRGRPLILAGESYAGVYIPRLAVQILDHNHLIDGYEAPIKLQGILLGNPYLNLRLMLHTRLDILKSNGIINETSEEFKEIRNLLEQYDQASSGDTITELGIQLEVMTRKIAHENDLDVYNIHRSSICHEKGTKFLNDRKLPYSVDDDQEDVSCLEESLDRFMNSEANQRAFHVQQSPTEDAKIWRGFDDGVYQSYRKQHDISKYMKKLIRYRVRTLIYFGEWDLMCDHLHGKLFVSHKLHLNNPTSEDDYWYVDDQIAGNLTAFSTKKFTYMTVREAGHMVPTDQPKRAFKLFESFLDSVEHDIKAEKIDTV